MIRQAFDRGELGRYVGAVRHHLDAPALHSAVGAAATGVGLNGDPVQALRAELPDISPGLASSGGRSFAAPDVPYISRDPFQSLVQSTVEQKLREHGAPEETPDRRDLLARIVRLIESVLHPVRYGPADANWVIDIAEAVLDRLAKGNHAFNRSPAQHSFSDQARIVIVGDWGTGLPRARAVAGHMAEQVEDALGRQRDVHVVHLGDVYYSGTHDEVRRKVLAPGLWPVTKEQASRGVSSWSLNGNHDMYGGGHGYFEELLGDRRFGAQSSPDGKPTSFFRLSSPSWEIVGLDTSWDPDPLAPGHAAVLEDPQADFVASVAQDAKRNNRKLMLLSHHQLISVYDQQDLGPVLGEKLRPVLDQDIVTAWLWGHEHRCMTFSTSQGVKFPRCIGHGGIPVPMTRTISDPYPPPGTWEERHFYKNRGDRWARFGFAVLDFHGAEIRVRYINDGGQPARGPETIS